jgi:hypothetical protein
MDEGEVAARHPYPTVMAVDTVKCDDSEHPPCADLMNSLKHTVTPVKSRYL